LQSVNVRLFCISQFIGNVFTFFRHSIVLDSQMTSKYCLDQYDLFRMVAIWFYAEISSIRTVSWKKISTNEKSLLIRWRVSQELYVLMAAWILITASEKPLVFDNWCKCSVRFKNVRKRVRQKERERKCSEIMSTKLTIFCKSVVASYISLNSDKSFFYLVKIIGNIFGHWVIRLNMKTEIRTLIVKI
jgi:hypothetical protein